MSLVDRRTLGPTGPSLSVVTLGTMRLPELVDGQPVWRFLADLADLGIDTHHSSVEYDSDPIYVDALRRAHQAGLQFRHIVKIAEPSWDHDRFDSARLMERVDEERSRLGVDHLDVVQWLVRTPDPTDEKVTIRAVERATRSLVRTIERLKTTGAVGSMVVFPYTAAFGVAAAELVDGVAVYLNPGETESLDLVHAHPTVAIRPFGGGRVPEAERADALAMVLGHATVSTAITSMSSRANATQVARWSLEQTKQVSPAKPGLEKSQVLKTSN